MSNPLKQLVLFVAVSLSCATCLAKDVKDTIYSAGGDRVIVNYSISQSGGQMTVKFNGVQKKLSKKNQEKFRKLDEIAVVIFDRTGNYKDIKFEGMGTEAFMVPSNLSYSRSEDGYFLLQESPSLIFSITSGNKAQLSIPLYLAHYEKKHRYKVISRCGTLQLSSTAKAGKKSAGGDVGDGEMREETITTTEEVTSEGISPADEASIRISSIKSMLDKATKVPFSDELNHEAEMLRELRFKVTDHAVSSQISQVLEAFDNKKQELEAQADANQAGAQAAKENQAKMDQARQDSIAAQQALQAAKDKKEIIWLVLGVVGLIGAYKIGTQVYQNYNTKKMQKKAQEKVLENMKKMEQKMNSLNQMNPMNNMNTQSGSNPLGRTIARQQQNVERTVERKVKTAAQKEAEAAKKKLMEKLGKKSSQNGKNRNISI